MFKKLLFSLTIVVISSIFLTFPSNSFAIGTFTFTVTNYAGQIYGMFLAPSNYVSAYRCTVHAIDESFIRNIACDGVPDSNGMLSAGASYNATFSPGTYYFEFVYVSIANALQTIYSYNFDVPPPTPTPTPTPTNVAPVVNAIADATIVAGETYTTNGSFTDSDSTSWTATVDYGDGSSIQPLTLNAMNFNLSHHYATTGKYTIIVVVRDNQLNAGIASVTITAIVPFSSFAFTVTNYDGHIYGIFPTPNNYISANRCTVHAIDENFIRNIACDGIPDSNGMLSAGASYNATFLPGTYYFEFAYVYTANVLQSVYSYNFEVPVPNIAPVISTITNVTVNEGGIYYESGSFSDPDSTSWTATVDYGDGSGVQSLTLTGMNFSLNHMYKDNGTYTVTVAITDNQGATGTTTATVTVNNVVPNIGTISASVNPILVNSSTTASAPFTDSGVLDTHTASWNWGDGNITTGTVTESNGSGSVSDSHTYTVTGVYTITLTIIDNDGGTQTQYFQYLSVYAPTPSGLFSGARIFTSPLGADIQNPFQTGQVQFGITSKYSGTTPTGNVNMNFKTGNLNFVANAITSLVTTGTNATLRGTGTINGTGNYTFLATGTDGHDTGGQDYIRFQIKNQSGSVVYDTQPGALDTASPSTPVTGNIIVH